MKSKPKKLDKATLYIPRATFKTLKKFLAQDEISVSEWFRGKVDEAIQAYELKQQTEGKERREVLQESIDQILSEHQA